MVQKMERGQEDGDCRGRWRNQVVAARMYAQLDSRDRLYVQDARAVRRKQAPRQHAQHEL